MQQTCVLIGELSLRVGDLANAKAFFARAKAYRQSNPALVTMAENGLKAVRQKEKGW
jgi:hypothetical protein